MKRLLQKGITIFLNLVADSCLISFFLFKIVIGIRQHFGLMAWKNNYEIILNHSGKSQGLKTIAFYFLPLKFL